MTRPFLIGAGFFVAVFWFFGVSGFMQEMMVTYDDILCAQERLSGHARYTPLLSAPQIDAMAGRRVFVKAECLQWTGSFKFRGAWNRISALTAAERRGGVVASSSGNHAQGVALSCQRLGIPATIIMPADAPDAKIDATRGYGAEIVFYDRRTEDRDALSRDLAAEKGAVLVPPFDDPFVIAGQGTCGLEIAEQARAEGIDSGSMLVCCGGGGLSSGIALALERDAPGLTVHPVEPMGFDDMTRSLAAGERVANAPGASSVQDAILTPMPGALTFPVARRLFGPGFVTSDEQALRAVALAWQWLKVVLEPGGATALAAALFQGADLPDGPVIVTASGGNVDLAMFRRALDRA